MPSPIPERFPKLSDRERDLLALLPADGTHVSTTELLEKFYQDDVPFNARQIIVDRMTTLIRKFDYAESLIEIRKTARRGPYPIEYWRAPRYGGGKE